MPTEYSCAVTFSPNDACKNALLKTGQGFQTIALGKIKEPGIYSVRAVQGNESQVIIFVAMPEGGKWELAPIVLACDAKASKTLFQKLAKAATKERLQAAVKAGFGKWSAKNAVGASTTVAVCLIPGATSVCVCVCVWGVADNSFEITTEFVSILEKSKELSADEATNLRLMLKVTNTTKTALKIARADSAFTKALEAIPAVADATLETDAGKMAVTFASDKTKKVMIFVRAVE